MEDGIEWRRRVRARLDDDLMEYTCSITNMLIVDPVSTVDGHRSCTSATPSRHGLLAMPPRLGQGSCWTAN